ncbi:Putative transcriptional regulator [Fulvivirga imtechensis AK7]|uniref:Putative transcriptional regulator n=1 Tax=Fulvivirga imtechensis AK7 TaxID=1237149 RepID=L8K041_9BACT|nr:WYL domain-containing protein [Fulvivirga imtechensis]ELR73299.1 Putative transcriptional regulator [Fulvivirga imtechensis AK7]
MAGKNQSTRIKVIDKCLRSGRKYTYEELAEACRLQAGIESVSERTINEDIRVMRNGETGLLKALIQKENSYFFYVEKGFSVFQSPIKDQETYILMNALDILNQFPEFKQSVKLKEVVDKVKNLLGISENIRNDIIQFERVDYPAASQWINRLYPHLQQKQPLYLKYQPFNAPEPFDLKIVPLLLKEYNSRWFLIAYDLDKSEVQNYPLDRIIDIEEYYLDISDISISFDQKNHFKQMVGVSVSSEGPKVIKFQVSDKRKKYIETKKIHSSQELVDAKNNTYQLYVHINLELIARLLSFGEDLKVISPPELIMELSDKISKMHENYLRRSN